MLASWAGDVIDYIGAKMRYIPRDGVTGVTGRGASPNGVTVELELTELPANDPRVKYALVSGFIRSTATASIVLSVYDGRDRTTRSGFLGTSGVVSRGSGAPNIIVPVGGTNGRSIGIGGSASTTGSYWLTVHGYYVVDSSEPVSGSAGSPGAPIPPADPSPGDEATADWAASLLTMAGKGWAYHPIPEATGTVRATAGAWSEAVPAAIPADAVAASCYLRMRPSDAANVSASLADSDGGFAGVIYSNGVASRYSTVGPFVVLLDATRQYRLSVSAVTQDTIVVFTGYWTRD